MELEQAQIQLIMAKKAQKRSTLTDGKDIPLSVTVDGANRHDKKLVKETLDAVILKDRIQMRVQNMCMDKGYDFPDTGELVKEYDSANIKDRGEENMRIKIPGFRARR